MQDALVVTLTQEQFRELIRDELKSAMKQSASVGQLLTPDELAGKLGVPVSWVYEQSRQGNIPTHRVGKYIRFDLSEVLEQGRIKGGRA